MTEPNLEDKIPVLEDTARQLGLYLGEAAVIANQDGRVALIASFSVGRVAWSDRVQNPENYTTAKQLAEMEAGIQKDDFLDIRAEIAERLARGEDPLGGEPDEPYCDYCEKTGHTFAACPQRDDESEPE